MRVGVIGINHKLADLKLREELAKAALKGFTLGISSHSQHYCVVLSTCNRTEIYFSSDDMPECHTHILSILREEVAEDFDQKLYSYFGNDCFMHLCRVTAGLDSAIIAETEIQGQVKAAYENAVSMAELPKDLHYLFQKSLRISKQVRTALPMGRGMPDVEHAVINTGKHLFGKPEEKKILIVGASTINMKIVDFLKNKEIGDITMCNRTQSKIGGNIAQVLPWEQLDLWHTYDWVIFGTKAPNHLIKPDHLPKECVGRKLIIDLSVPRNVDPLLAKDPRVTLLNIDQINRMLRIRKGQLMSCVYEAEELITELVQRHVDLYQKKKYFVA